MTTHATRPAPAPATAATRHAWSARGWAIYLGWVVITLDGSALNLALPTIGTDLRTDPAGISWVVDAYTLPLAALLLLGGSLGDRLGAARLFRVGSIGFAVASIGCAVAPSIGVLVGLRAVQGVFGAMLLPMTLALAAKSFADPRERLRAVNLMTVFGGIGLAAGPFLGGLLTDAVGWRSVFWLTAPISVVAAVLVGRCSRGELPTAGRRVDVLGQVAGTLGLVLLVSGLIEAGRDTDPLLPVLLLVSGAVVLAVFVTVERRVEHPMMPLDVFAAPRFRSVLVGGFAYQFAAYGLPFFLALHLQRVWDVTASTGGLLLAPFALGVVAAGAVLNPRVSHRGPRFMFVTGATIALVATLGLLPLDGLEDWPWLTVCVLLFGLGAGMFSTTLNTVASSSLGADRAGLAAGIYNTFRQVGMCVGIAVLGAMAALNDTDLGHAMAIGLAAACSLAILVLGLRLDRGVTPARG